MRRRRLFWQLYPATLMIALVSMAVVALSLPFYVATVAIAAALAVAGLLIARRIIRPLEELRQHAECLARGDLKHRLSASGAVEIRDLADTLDQMAADLDDKLATVVRQRNERDAILSSMVEGVVAMDAEGRVLSVNAAAVRLLGADSSRVEGRTLPEIIRSIDLHKLVATVLSTQQPVEGEVVIRDRALRFLYVHGTVLREGPDARAGALLVIHDVTELKRLESIRRDFVANVSHELKTPVTSIQGYVETLLDGAMNDAEKREKFLKIVAKHTDRLYAILEDLLTLARVEQDGDKCESLLASGPVRPVLEAALADCAVKAEEKRMRLTLNCPAGLIVAMNASLLEQAVVNLLENAIAYSPEGESVEVDCMAGEREIEIRVCDRGCGIAREHVPRIFERFYRVDKSRSRESGGTGLGLAIVKHIMQLHGGHPAVESTPGKGSTFSLFLPKGNV